MKKKKKGTGILIAILLFVILAGAAVVFFGFINDPTAIEIRRYLAGKYVEKGNDDKAESLYYDILNRDETDTSSYLALGDIYLRSEDLEDAHEILREGLEYAPSQDIALKEWSVYEKEAKQIEAGGAGKELLDFVNSIPADDLRGYMDDKGAADKYAKDDARRWGDSILALAKMHMDHADAPGAQKILEDAIDAPLNEFADLDAFTDMLIDVYLAQGNTALESGDKDKNAKYFFDKVLALDPQNKEALEGLAKLSSMEDDSQKWKKIDIDAVVKAELLVNMHGIKLTVPVTVKIDAFYDGTSPGAEVLTVDEDLTLSMLGRKEEQSESIKVYQDLKDMVIESDLTGRQVEKNTSLKDTLFEFIADYQAIAGAAPVSGSQTVNGIRCDVRKTTMKGKDYLYYTPRDIMPDGAETLCTSLVLDVTRYTAADDGRVVRVEATMQNIDQDALAELIAPYLAGLKADITIESLDAVIDVDCK